MTEKEIKENQNTNQAPTQPKKVETLKGYTTSQINQALKADNPYPARVFLKVDNQDQDIPVFFRIKAKQDCQFHSNCSADCRYKKDWLKPKIPTGSQIEIKGHFAINKEYFPNCKMRRSFTAYHYRLLECPHSQKKPYHCPTDCPCEKGKEIKKKQAIIQEAKTQFPYLKTQVSLIQRRTKEKEIYKVREYDK